MSIPPPMNNCYWRSLLSSDFFRTCYLSLCLVIQLRSDREGDIVFSLRFRFIWANNSSYLLRISYYCKTKVSFVFRHQLLFKNEFGTISFNFKFWNCRCNVVTPDIFLTNISSWIMFYCSKLPGSWVI